MTVPRTPSQTVGPFFKIGLCRRPDNELVPVDGPGAVRLIGSVVDGDDMPIDDAIVEVWDGARWGRAGTDAEGRFQFVVAKPPPRDGDAPRLDVFVFARGLLKHQLTRVYFPDEAAANDADDVLSSLDRAERETLIAVQEDGVLRFDVRMQGERETVFFAV
jgi:protocatechuate 3,4-dioxygenase, alpha subunit